MKTRFIAAAAVMALLSACATTGETEEDFSTTKLAEQAIGQTARDRVFFSFDKAELDQDAILTLKAQALYLQQNPEKTVRIEGHADERGTTEYNMALGARRANIVKKYLTTQGIDASRITTTSYGKERPAVIGNNEEAWSQNRRAVTVIQD